MDLESTTPIYFIYMDLMCINIIISDIELESVDWAMDH